MTRAEQLAAPGHVQQRRAYEEFKSDHGGYRVPRQGEDWHASDHPEGRRATRTHCDSPEVGLKAKGIETFAYVIEAAYRYPAGSDEHISTQATGDALGDHLTVI